MKIKIVLFSFVVLQATVFLSAAWSVPHSVVLPKQQDSAGHKVTFFENSLRRDLNEYEKAFLVRVEVDQACSCAGFFTENSNKDFLITTARHCAYYYFTEACQQGKVSIVTESGGFKGVCSEVVASDHGTDIVTFRARFDADQSARIGASIAFLRLKAGDPDIGTALKMLGYPADPDRGTRATVTENCWINANNPDDSSAWSYYTKSERLQIIEESKKGGSLSSLPADYSQRQNRISTQYLGHNCTTYRGNSGGPMLVAGTDMVVGLPANYSPGMFRGLPSSASEYMYRMSEFVVNNRASLQAAGVVLVP